MKIINWHREKLENFAYRRGLTMYQMSWFSFLKGSIIGYFIGEYL